MKYLALACDYDGTIAEHGKVHTSTVEALQQVRNSGRRLLLVTGRELDHLRHDFPRLDLFESVVAENGAVIYLPDSGEEITLCHPPPQEFVDEIHGRGIEPVSVGRVIVASWHPNEAKLLEIIRNLGLELQVIFNKGAVMVLPPGINKASGLRAALERLKLSPHNAVGVGDAENDHAFLEICGCSIAVANALPAIKQKVDWTTKGERGAGVEELIAELIESDFRKRKSPAERSALPIGVRPDGSNLMMHPLSETLMVAGTSGSGKSTLTTGIIDNLASRHFQFCIIDPEGDYEELDGAVVWAAADPDPDLSEAVALLESPSQNLVVNLVGVGVENRPEVFQRLLQGLASVYQTTGRPHVLVVDEAHHFHRFLPSSNESGLANCCQAALLVTVHPDHVEESALKLVDRLIVIGAKREATIAAFAEAAGWDTPILPDSTQQYEAWIWTKYGKHVEAFEPARNRTEHRRHQRKYTEGKLEDDRCFYFRGPAGKLNLKAHNLMAFKQMADGVDDETWLYHLRRGDYSRWFREAIKDQALASKAEDTERSADVSPEESRRQIRKSIESLYTAAA
jgi:hypothetical protein